MKPGHKYPGADPGFEGGADKRPPKAVAPRGSDGMLPRKKFNFRASEMRFPAFSGAIWSSLIALKSPWFTFFLTTRLIYVFTFSLGGSTEPPLDPP